MSSSLNNLTKHYFDYGFISGQCSSCTALLSGIRMLLRGSFLDRGSCRLTLVLVDMLFHATTLSVDMLFKMSKLTCRSSDGLDNGEAPFQM